MDIPKRFRIGDVAKLFHLSVGTLRHYEKAGLLAPEYIDPDTGYRYYSTRQFDVLNNIRYLRVLDMPLEQIADFLQNKDIEVIEEKLHLQKEAVIQKQHELALIERKIDNRLRQLHDARTAKLDVIHLETASACRIVWMLDHLKIKSYFDMETPIRKLDERQTEAMVFLGKVGIGIAKERLIARQFEQYDGIFLVLDEEDTYHGDIEEVPAELCVSIRFCGSHKEAAAQYQKLMDYIAEHKLQVTGFSREITMIDYGITNDVDRFVTEIRIPVV